jgi:hypothetical protein
MFESWTGSITRQDARQKVETVQKADEAICAVVQLYANRGTNSEDVLTKAQSASRTKSCSIATLSWMLAKFKMHLGKMLENTLSGTIKPMSV